MWYIRINSLSLLIIFTLTKWTLGQSLRKSISTYNSTVEQATINVNRRRSLATDLSQVDVYASNTHHDPASTIARSLSTPNPFFACLITLSQDHKIGSISEPPSEFIITFTLKPFDQASVWTNIIRFTSTSNNCCDYGDRWIAVWFFPNSFTNLFKAGSTIDGDAGGAKSGAQPNIMNRYRIEALGNSIRFYRDRMMMSEVPLANRPALSEVNVYASDMFHDTPNAELSSLIFSPIQPATTEPSTPNAELCSESSVKPTQKPSLKPTSQPFDTEIPTYTYTATYIPTVTYNSPTSIPTYTYTQTYIPTVTDNSPTSIPTYTYTQTYAPTTTENSATEIPWL